jgi:hypothetical protein
VHTRVSIYTQRRNIRIDIQTVPDLSDGHRLFHCGVKGVALLAGEDVEYFDATVSLTSSDVFVVGVEAHAESLLGSISQGILVLHFNL